MDYWTSHHFSGKRDDEGKFKGKGELQLMQVQQNVLLKLEAKVVYNKVRT